MKSWQLIILQNYVCLTRLHLAAHCVREVIMKCFFTAVSATLRGINSGEMRNKRKQFFCVNYSQSPAGRC